MSNEKLKIQLEEKDKTVQNLRRAVEHLELKAGERSFVDMQVGCVPLFQLSCVPLILDQLCPWWYWIHY